MKSEKYIGNKICINTFEDFLKSAIESCILIEKYQGYFVRNIFKAASAFRSSFNKNEHSPDNLLATHLTHHLMKMKTSSYYV